ncbi:MAG: molecular chaperone TorD family protein [Verrucomicrobiales bacterium]|nr:molecular chaperone TorD family protein [Verrucomicrobiales bacterium]
MARAFVYRHLACGFEDPTIETWDYLASSAGSASLREAVTVLAAENPSLVDAARAFGERWASEGFDEFQSTYLAAFGHAARGQCPMNEIEYGDLKADPLFQPHRLADLAAFYRAFGLELTEDATERHDHLCLELEFMCVLAAKEAWAIEQASSPLPSPPSDGAEGAIAAMEPGLADHDHLGIVRDAQKKFLREHLGRWAPAFARRLHGLAGDSALGALAELLRVFVESECRLFGVPAGSEDLLLRPVDETTESLCDSCGVHARPPGALPPEPVET